MTGYKRLSMAVAAMRNAIEAFSKEVRRRVKANSGVELEWEIQRVGKPQ